MSNLPLKSQKNAIFRNFCGRFFGRKQTNAADLWPEGPFDPQVIPKFFLSRTDKNSWFYLKKTFRTTCGPNGPSGHKSIDFVCFLPKNGPQKLLKIAFFGFLGVNLTFFFQNFIFATKSQKMFFEGFFYSKRLFSCNFSHTWVN